MRPGHFIAAHTLCTLSTACHLLTPSSYGFLPLTCFTLYLLGEIIVYLFRCLTLQFTLFRLNKFNMWTCYNTHSVKSSTWTRVFLLAKLNYNLIKLLITNKAFCIKIQQILTNILRKSVVLELQCYHVFLECILF